MDFLKKHFEKVVLTVALLLLIVTVVYLAFKLGETNEGTGPVRTTGEPVPPLDISTYTNAISSLGNPPQWSKIEPDLFGQPPVIRSSGPTGEVVEGLPVSVLRVAREPFKLLFKEYSWDAQKKEGYNFQINFRDFRKSFFVQSVGKPVQDDFENTGYKIVKFERKFVEFDDPQLGRKVEKDVSELSLQHEGENPILLVWGQEAEEKEPVALIQCAGGTQTRKVARGQKFVCGGKTYIVVDMNQTQMIIVDTESGKKHTIGLTGSR